MMKTFLSVLTTLYQSAPHLEEFYQRMVAAASKVTDDFEIVFVDDGSPDDSAQVVKRFLEGRHRVRFVELARNYGHHRAVMAGLSHVQGDLVFLIDCDLEEPPELLLDTYRSMRASEGSQPSDVVYVVQRFRDGRFFDRLSGRLFYAFFNLLSPTQIQPDCMMARLMTHRYVEALRAHQETELFLNGVMRLAGFHQTVITADKKDRGVSSYTFGTRLLEAVTALTSFSDRPLTMIFLLGLALSLLSICAILYLVVEVVFLKAGYVSGWASLLAAVCLFGGMNLLAIGILGIYLARVFLEVKRRPCIVKNVTFNGRS